MADQTKSSATSSQKRFWACNRTRYQMDIQLTEEQELLRSSVQRLLRDRYDFNNIATTARRQGENYVLSGTKAAVIGAPWADKLIVSARTSGGPRDRSGVSLFVVDRHSANLHVQGFKTIDGRRAAEVALMNVEVPANQLLGTEGEGVAALEACRDRATAAPCAEAISAMTDLNAATLEYSKTRKQFGTTLGSFQVLQHRMVDMFIALEEGVSRTQHLNRCRPADERP